MPKWEYKSLRYKPNTLAWDSQFTNEEEYEKEYIHKLNKLGEDGWELVDILHYTSNGNLYSVCFILKRQVNE